jgi:hypothetical protein
MVWLGTAGGAFQNDPLDQEFGYFAIYRKNDFTDAGRWGRISDGVMVVAAGSRPEDRKEVYS